MKEKRYYCDWIDVFYTKNKSRIFKFLFISVVVLIVVGGIINYNIIMRDYGQEFEAYSESAYEYLDEIANNVISENGIDATVIPEDVVEYEITYKDGKTIFKYSIDNNKGKKWATSASTTITLSKDFEILSKEPNYFSKKEYVTSHKISLYVTCFVLGACYCGEIIGSIIFVNSIAVVISMNHKEKDAKNETEKNLS